MTRVIELGSLALVAGGLLLACAPSEPLAGPATQPGFLSPSPPPAAVLTASAPVVFASAPREPVQDPPEESARIAELERQLADSRAKEAQLRDELATSESRRIEREHEWLEYSYLLGMVSKERLPGGKTFSTDLPGVDAGPADEPTVPDPEKEALELARQTRSQQIARSLRTLFTLEDVLGMDLLECGLLDTDAIGPVVFRLVDGRGRLAGSLYAERMRMEASVTARTLTLVLEQGYEMRAGARIAFEGAAPEAGKPAARRIVLAGVDPLAWADEFRELFGEDGLDLSGDDGLWDLAIVKNQLNELLKLRTPAGAYRLRDLGGVQDGILSHVHVERLDEEGNVERRFFADRMRIVRAGGGVELQLDNGTQVRGEDERVPFLDGRYRILLPAADAEAWTRAGIPGLSPPPGPRERTAKRE